MIAAIKDEVRTLLRKSIDSRARYGLSFSYLNSYLLVYLRNTLEKKEFGNAVLLISKPLAAPFFNQIYGNKAEWITEYNQLVQTRTAPGKPAVAVLGGKSPGTLADTLRIAANNGKQCVIALLEDFKSLIENLAQGRNGELLTNYLLVVDVCKHDFSSRRSGILEKKGWSIYIFEGQSFGDLVSLIQQARGLRSAQKPAVIFLRSPFNQILI